jgi:hypothetical protein
LTAETRERSPRSLFWQHLDQQVQGVNRREQTQQVNAKELGGGMRAVPAPGGTVRPALVDEIVRNKRIQEFKQSHRAGGRKTGIHVCQPASENLTRQRQSPPLQFQTHELVYEQVVKTFVTHSFNLQFGIRHERLSSSDPTGSMAELRQYE